MGRRRRHSPALIGSGDEPAACLYSLADPPNPKELAKLPPPDEAVALEYATKVDIAGNVAVVGARDDTEAEDRAGAVYLYDISDPSNPSYLAKLMASDAARFDKLGTSVACTEGLVLGGAPGWQHGDTWRGAGYVFLVPEPTTLRLLGPGGLAILQRGCYGPMHPRR